MPKSKSLGTLGEMIGEKVQRLSSPPPKSKATPKRDGPPSAAQTQPPKKETRKRVEPWDNPEIRKDIETCRPKILALLSNGAEITKQGCAEALGIDASLAGRTLSYMMTVKKEITMISPPPTQDDPDPKKRFRLKQK